MTMWYYQYRIKWSITFSTIGGLVLETCWFTTGRQGCPHFWNSLISALVQVMAWRRPGDKPFSEPMMVRLVMHICHTQPHWVKACEEFPYWSDDILIWKYGLWASITVTLDSSLSLMMFSYPNLCYLRILILWLWPLCLAGKSIHMVSQFDITGMEKDRLFSNVSSAVVNYAISMMLQLMIPVNLKLT